MPPATAGDESTKPPVVADHNGVHTFGAPEHWTLPAASNAENVPPDDPT